MRIGRAAFLLTDMMQFKVHLGTDFKTEVFVAAPGISSSICLIRKFHWAARKLKMPPVLPQAQHVA